MSTRTKDSIERLARVVAWFDAAIIVVAVGATYVVPDHYSWVNVAWSVFAGVCLALFVLAWNVLDPTFRRLQEEQMTDGIHRSLGKLTLTEMLGNTLRRFVHWLETFGYALMTLGLLALSALGVYGTFAFSTP